MLEVERTALAFARACDGAGVRYALMGGVAVSAWGQPRATADVDVLVSLRIEQVPRFAVALRSEGLVVDERDFEDAFRDDSHVTIFDDKSPFHVDCKIARGEESAEVDRAVEVAYEGERLRLVAPEETIAFKLKFGSPQDVQDARSILVRQEGRLDLARLRDLARRLGVEKALDEMMAE